MRNHPFSFIARPADSLVEAIEDDLCLVELEHHPGGKPRGFRLVRRRADSHAAKTVRRLPAEVKRQWLEQLVRVGTTGQTLGFESRAGAQGPRLHVRISRAGVAASQQFAVLLTELSADAGPPGVNADFVATVAHELRNFLAPLASGIEILRARFEPQMLHRVLPMMERQVEHMTGLVNDLMDGGDVALAMRPLPLQPLATQAAEAVATLLARREQNLALDLPATALWVHADPLRLAQVLSNLLTNAIKYTPPGGSIRLSARAQDGEVCIVVADCGVGIPAQELPRVFELYRQVPGHAALAQGGRGIGLWVVRKLVELQGGTVQATSPGAGQGSAFEVRLPQQPQPSAQARAAAAVDAVLAAAAMASGRRRIDRPGPSAA